MGSSSSVEREESKLIFSSILSKVCEHYRADITRIPSDGSGGLVGPSAGLLTCMLERIIGSSKIIRMHTVLHDVFGRVRTYCGVGPGYTYCLSWSFLPRTFAFGGNVSGLIWVWSHREKSITQMCDVILSRYPSS